MFTASAVLGSLTLPEPEDLAPQAALFYKLGQTTLEPHGFYNIFYTSTIKLLQVLHCNAIVDLSSQ